MSGLFGRPKMPEIRIPPVPLLPPSPAEISEEKVIEEEKKKLRQGRTSRATILTGPRGILTQAPVIRKTLLGE